MISGREHTQHVNIAVLSSYVPHAEHYGYSVEELTVLSGGHSIGFSASTNPQVCSQIIDNHAWQVRCMAT